MELFMRKRDYLKEVGAANSPNLFLYIENHSPSEWFSIYKKALRIIPQGFLSVQFRR